MTQVADPEIVIGSNRRGITPAMRRAILGDNQDNDCQYCGQLAAEVDHIVPFSRGGGLDLENLAAACSRCNSEKSMYTLEEWSDKRRSAGKPWPIPSLWSRIAELAYRTKLRMGEKEFNEAVYRESWCEDIFGSREELYARFIALRDVHPLPTSQPIPCHWLELISDAHDLPRLRDIWRRAKELGDLTSELKAAAKFRSEELRDMQPGTGAQVQRREMKVSNA